MTASYTYDGDDLTRVRRDSVELVSTAELGTVGSSSLTYNDTAGTQEIIGDKDFEANEDDCATPLLVRGFIGDRSYYRGQESVGMGREIDINVDDLNSVLGFRFIDGNDRRRPEESVNARMSWLMGSDYLSGLVIDNGRIASSTQTMNKADYSNQYPRDVIADCALAARGFNFHVQDYGSTPELIFRNDNTSTADSVSMKISNVLADGPWDIGDTVTGSTIFAPYKDFRLTRRPGLVWSKIALSYAKGTRIKARPATAAAFNGERGGNASNSNIKKATQADAEAVHQLIEHATEEDVIEGSILVPSEAVNLFPAGFRIQAKSSFLTTEGYGSYTWFRILEVGKKPLLKPAALYELRLKLSPQEGLSDTPGCDFDPTPDGTYYPLGGQADPQQSNPSDGVVVYYRPGAGTEPTTPAEALGFIGHWHFPEWASGGAGTIDYAGDCVQNDLRFVLVGDGTCTVQTEMYVSGPRAMIGYVYKQNGDLVSSQSFTSGDEVSFVIDDTGGADCIRLISISDASWPVCGGKWGWSAMEWVGA